MTDFTTLTILDGEDTPVSHAYGKTLKDENNVLHFEAPGVLPLSEEALSLTTRKTVTRRKAELRMADPIVVDDAEVGDPVEARVLRVGRIRILMDVDRLSTALERKNLFVKAQNAMANADIESVFVDFEYAN